MQTFGILVARMAVFELDVVPKISRCRHVVGGHAWPLLSASFKGEDWLLLVRIKTYKSVP